MCPLIPHFSWHSSSFHRKCLAKKCPLLLHFSRHFPSFQKSSWQKSVLYFCTFSGTFPLSQKVLGKNKCLRTRIPVFRIFCTPGCWPKTMSLFFVGSSKKNYFGGGGGGGGVPTRPPSVPFIFVPQENFTAKLDWLGHTRLSPQIYPNFILSPYSELIVK